jgi:hypothetical protein
MTVNIGYILIGVSILILMAVLYGQNRRREQFTNMKGNFPNWAVIVEQVKTILDKHYDYDASKLAELATKQKELYSFLMKSIDDAVKSGQGGILGGMVEFVYGMPTPELIKQFMDNKDVSKHLPKGVTLNVDLPFDTRMAMIAAVSELSKDMVKKAKNENDIAIGYSLSYATTAAAAVMKNLSMPLLIGKAIQDTGAKMKPSGISSIVPK